MSLFFPEPDGREARPAWVEVPEAVIHQIENLLKDKIISAATAWGGYAPSACFTAELSSGRKVFIKGTHPGQDAHGTQILRQEINSYHTIPEIKSFAPEYLGQVWDGSEDGWMLAIFEYINTTPVLPWTTEKIQSCLKLLAKIHSSDRSRVVALQEKKVICNLLRPESGWVRIAENPDIFKNFLNLFDDKNEGRHWLEVNLPFFCRKQKEISRMEGVSGIIHTDLRSDNILLDKSGRVMFIDWPDACFGPAVIDLAYFLSSVSGESPFKQDVLLKIYEDEFGKKIDRNDLVLALVSISGYLANQAYRAVPKKLPRLRWVQKTILLSALKWIETLAPVSPLPRLIGQNHD